MKTLDEVIEIASDWTNGFDESSIEKQMLYYLKMYRSDQEQWGFFQKNYEDELKQKIKDFGDAKERYIKRLKELDIGTLNDPLTWDELRTMEGKPVLVEWISGTWKGLHKWILIRRIEDLIMEFTALDVARVSYDGNLQKYCLGKTWQAYRKERE